MGCSTIQIFIKGERACSALENSTNLTAVDLIDFYYAITEKSKDAKGFIAKITTSISNAAKSHEKIITQTFPQPFNDTLLLPEETTKLLAKFKVPENWINPEGKGVFTIFDQICKKEQKYCPTNLLLLVLLLSKTSAIYKIGAIFRIAECKSKSTEGKIPKTQLVEILEMIFAIASSLVPEIAKSLEDKEDIKSEIQELITGYKEHSNQMINAVMDGALDTLTLQQTIALLQKSEYLLVSQHIRDHVYNSIMNKALKQKVESPQVQQQVVEDKNAEEMKKEEAKKE